MPLEVFPSLDGLTYEIDLEPEFNTHLFRPVDRSKGRESAVILQEYPVVSFTLNYDFLLKNQDEDQMVALLSFFYRHYGRAKPFLFDYPEDNAATLKQLGVGDGSRVNFQLIRSLGVPGFTEPVNFVRPVEDPQTTGLFSPYIYVDDVLQTIDVDYTLSASGLVVFGTAPPNASIVRWTGNYYYLCRFAEDKLKISQSSVDLFYSSLSFYGSPVNIVGYTETAPEIII